MIYTYYIAASSWKTVKLHADEGLRANENAPLILLFFVSTFVSLD
jgi:hypothetical protein